MAAKEKRRKSKLAGSSVINEHASTAHSIKVLTPEILESLPKKTKLIERTVVEVEDPDSDTASDDAEEEITDLSAVSPTGTDAGEMTDISHPDAVLDPSSPHYHILKRYLEEVSRYSLLTPEEEFSLGTKLKETGDLEAARRLVSANLRLVVKIAMEYRSAYQNVMDLIQEGNVGLMKAVSKFDPYKGAKLSYYASWWIRSYILKYILDNFRLIKVGTTQAQKKLFFHLMREKEKLEAQGMNSGPKLLADKLNVKEEEVIEMEQRLGGAGVEMSLNQPFGGEEGESSTTRQDLIPDHEPGQDDLFSREQLFKILKDHLGDFAKTLREKELAIFKERLMAEEPKTLQEVADLFGLTRERARQIEVKVIEKLREYYKKYIH
jgi:RNA polymerase sigma-32 factor